MGMRIDTGGMQVRLKAPKVGDVAVVNNEVYFYLPEGLPHRTQAVLVGHAPGRYIVRALGRDWNIAMQCVEHEQEWCYAGQLDKVGSPSEACAGVDRSVACTGEDEGGPASPCMSSCVLRSGCLPIPERAPRVDVRAGDQSRFNGFPGNKLTPKVSTRDRFMVWAGRASHKSSSRPFFLSDSKRLFSAVGGI